MGAVFAQFATIIESGLVTKIDGFMRKVCRYSDCTRVFKSKYAYEDISIYLFDIL